MVCCQEADFIQQCTFQHHLVLSEWTVPVWELYCVLMLERQLRTELNRSRSGSPSRPEPRFTVDKADAFCSVAPRSSAFLPRTVSYLAAGRCSPTTERWASAEGPRREGPFVFHWQMSNQLMQKT